jgi:hypothetical protein
LASIGDDIMDMNYGSSTGTESSKVEVTIGEQTVQCYLKVMAAGKSNKQTVWMKMRIGESDFYIVGIQSDGSILRAHGCYGTGFPLETRDSFAKVAIRHQVKEG